MFKAIQKTIFGSASDDDEATDKPSEGDQQIKRPKVDEVATETKPKTPEKKQQTVHVPLVTRPVNAKVSSRGWVPEETKPEEGVADSKYLNTYKTISDSFEGLFMGEEEMSKIKELLKDNPLSEIDFKWHATLDDVVEGCTTCLRIDGMRPPYSTVLFRTFVEKPGPSAALEGPDAFKTIGSTIFITCSSIESARRQFRRLNGHVWQGQVDSTLSVKYTTPEEVQSELENHTKKVSEEEARLRKTMEDKLQESQRKATEAENKPKTPTKEKDVPRDASERPQKKRASDYFAKTTSLPRVFYELEEDAGKIADATTRAQEEYDKLIAAH